MVNITETLTNVSRLQSEVDNSREVVENVRKIEGESEFVRSMNTFVSRAGETYPQNFIIIIFYSYHVWEVSSVFYYYY